MLTAPELTKTKVVIVAVLLGAAVATGVRAAVQDDEVNTADNQRRHTAAAERWAYAVHLPPDGVVCQSDACSSKCDVSTASGQIARLHCRQDSCIFHEWIVPPFFQVSP